MNPFQEMENSMVERIVSLVTEKVVERLTNVFESQQSSARYLSRKEAAAELKISLPTLDKLTREGKLQAIRLGEKRVLYPADIVAEIIKEGRVFKYVR